MEPRSKFIGKIRDNPLIALERGNRDVMLTLWREYLTEILELDPKSGRRRRLIQRLEHAGNFDQLYGDWNDLSTQERAERWLALIRTTKAILAEVKDLCLRCGDCCLQSSPTLTVADYKLFQEDILGWTEVYTLRRGERGVDPRSGEVKPIPAERLKIKEHAATKNCLFYATNPNRCLIYEHRPQQCREQLCNRREEELPPPATAFLTREAFFGQHPELWALINAHEERCAIARLEQALKQLADRQDEASETLFDMLHFDHYLRQLLLTQWEIPAGAMDFLLGRPLTQLLPQLGLKAEMTADGVFRLEPI
ncbi:MAG: YkgJ family cysteine cluster protein [Desulfobacca sp.]|uniref:YkgJ family cysteine cluster protein n=1 Tax=Desulfobacca sp. TaxID=2067990 RepID=UPI004049CE3E